MKRSRKDGGQNPHPTSHPPPLAMGGTLSSYSPTVETLFSVIYECIQELVKLYNGILQREKSLCQGESLDKEEQDVLCIKSSVVSRIEKIFKECGQNPLPRSHSPVSAMEITSGSSFPTAQTAFTVISECILDLHLMMQHGMSTSLESLDEEQQHMKSRVVCRIEKLFKETVESDDEDMDMDMNMEGPTVGGSRGLDPFPILNSVQGKESDGQFNKEEFIWSSVNEKEIKETERYLCVSNGFEIWCLDLKQSKRNDDYLPRITTMNLLGEDLPSSVGLFKLGSDAYMIGGQELPASLKDPEHSLGWGNPQGIDLYQALCNSEGVKGSSCVTYRLSLQAAADKDGTVSLSHPKACSDIEELKQPKFWPIVEKIGKKLHVLDSVPALLNADKCGIFSHEARNLEGGGWEQIPTIEGTAAAHISSHVVVGNRIYALTTASDEAFHFIEFDSETGKWKQGCSMEWLDGLQVKQVQDILDLGIGRCVGEYSRNHYVLIAVLRDFSCCPQFPVSTVAVAYLVTSMGQVLCYQILPDFFTGPLKPCAMQSGTIIHVEDKEWGTMCSVVCATLEQNATDRDYLFINTFSVSLLPDAADRIEQLLVKKASEVEAKPAVELKFVSVAVKDWYIYAADAHLDYGLYGCYYRFAGWQACFLTP